MGRRFGRRHRWPTSSNPHQARQAVLQGRSGPGRSRLELSTGGDLALPEIEQTAPLPDRIVNRYMERLMATAAHDEVVARAFFEVAGMLKPPTALLTPAIARRALRRGAVERPQAQAPLTTGAEATAHV